MRSSLHNHFTNYEYLLLRVYNSDSWSIKCSNVSQQSQLTILPIVNSVNPKLQVDVSKLLDNF